MIWGIMGGLGSQIALSILLWYVCKGVLWLHQCALLCKGCPPPPLSTKKCALYRTLCSFPCISIACNIYPIVWTYIIDTFRAQIHVLNLLRMLQSEIHRKIQSYSLYPLLWASQRVSLQAQRVRTCHCTTMPEISFTTAIYGRCAVATFVVHSGCSRTRKIMNIFIYSKGSRYVVHNCMKTSLDKSENAALFKDYQDYLWSCSWVDTMLWKVLGIVVYSV